MRLLPIGAIAGLCAASAAAHDPRECRTELARFEEHRTAFETSADAAGPILERLSEAYDEAVAADGPARRHAVLYRHFVAAYPELRPHLTGTAETGREAVAAAVRAIVCLRREKAAAE